MFQNIFAIDSVQFSKNENDKTKYLLNNYNQFLPKLKGDFYLRYFTKEILFDIDILEVNDFLNFQFEHTENTDKLIDILKLKVLPTTQSLIDNAYLSDYPGPYSNEKSLDYGFIETNGVILNDTYEDRVLFGSAKQLGKKEDLIQRKEIISLYINEIIGLDGNKNIERLSWHGNLSHLALIIRELIEHGYIDPPLRGDDEINTTQLSKLLLKAFRFDKNINTDSNETLRRYLNPDYEKSIALRKKFVEQGFHIPNSKMMN
ncbi:hypothetical protein NQT66_13095 [Cellulophaga baltica]|uniref:hypothetical protein n=1 Tax=Cellulophaga baltica TaxID=76594 RepID=UPI0021485582|nr:hypothetical protein [Cellulophaga baltica]MCR1025752.1 hypothetical protein [Cellulophaga baltica]